MKPDFDFYSQRDELRKKPDFYQQRKELRERIKKDPLKWEYIQNINDPAFNDFASKAYSNPKGYSFRYNPRTNKNEMFVAGTRIGSEWANNAGEMFMRRPWVTPSRRDQKKYLDKLAKKKQVDVVYGHSRGGAVVSDMEGDFDRVGLSAAMAIAKDKNMKNFHTGSRFDKMIGVRGRNNIRTNVAGKNVHRPWAYSDNRWIDYKRMKDNIKKWGWWKYA